MYDNKCYWDKCAKIYDKVMFKYNSAYGEIYTLILKRLNQDTKVLEVAAGTGLITRNIAKGVKQIEAIDFSQEMINHAKDNNTCENVKFKVMNACYLPYADSMFDAVIISNALHIMPNPQKALDEAKRVLKKDGILIAPTFTYKESIKDKFLSNFFWISRYKAFFEWTPQEYLKFLYQNGFKITYWKLINTSPPLTYAEATPLQDTLPKNTIKG